MVSKQVLEMSKRALFCDQGCLLVNMSFFHRVGQFRSEAASEKRSCRDSQIPFPFLRVSYSFSLSYVSCTFLAGFA